MLMTQAIIVDFGRVATVIKVVLVKEVSGTTVIDSWIFTIERCTERVFDKTVFWGVIVNNLVIID